jgi:large subunit ribosomal protein L35
VSAGEEADIVPKLKTHRGAAKRFKLSGSGKIVRSKANKNHILTKKSAKRKRRLRQDTVVAAADVPRIRRLIPTR